MPERLLTPEQVAEQLGIPRSQFYRLKPALIAKGMRTVVVGRRRKFIESSLDRVIQTASEKEMALC